MLKEFLKNRITKNASWLIGGHIAQMIISFIVSVLTARYLGPSNYGLINYGTAYTAFFTSLCTLGINSVIVKELVDNREKEGQVIGTSIALKSVSSLLSCFTIFAIVSIIDKDQPLVIMVTVLCSLGLFINVLDVFKYWFQSYLKSKINAIVGLIGYAVVSFYKIVLMITNQNVIWFAFSSAIDYFCVGLGLYFIYKKQGGQRLNFSLSYAKSLLKKSIHFVFPSLMVSIYAQTDKIMMKQMLGDAEVGFYSTAIALSSMWCFVLQAVIDSFNPSILEAKKAGDNEGYIYKNKLLYAIIFYISIVVSIFYCLLARPMIYILYGEMYLPTVEPLRIITWYTAFSYLGVARNVWVVSENKQKYLIFLYVSAAFTNVILNLFLIPIWGGAGAAFASLCSQIISSIISPWFIKDIRPNAKLILDGVLFRGIFSKK